MDDVDVVDWVVVSGAAASDCNHCPVGVTVGSVVVTWVGDVD